MKKEEAINLFGSGRKLAQALGIEPEAVYQWSNKEDIPELRAFQIDKMLREGHIKVVQCST